MNKSGFGEFFEALTGHKPFPFQRRFVEQLQPLVHIPTGLGKTAMAVLGWLWRRRSADKSVRQATPRRLVYCLPMRVLVEQTHDNAVRWLHRLGLLAGRAGFDGNELVSYSPPRLSDLRMTEPEGIAVYVLMGGEDEPEWDVFPERDAILIGTQDMLLSRALNRGYAACRSRWPMQFGLLHTDCMWVFDEIQLMGSGLATTAQLEAFRRLLPREEAETAKNRHGCRCVWMSATLNDQWLGTVDFKPILPNELRLTFDFESEIASGGIDPRAKGALEDRWNATKPLSQASSTMGDHDALAEEIVGKHVERSGLTLVVVNTVHRAQELHTAIGKHRWEDGAPKVVLLHSRFRPPDRERKVGELLDPELNRDMICVSTQVVEAGLDVDATTLFTELAPWASLVQRFGRCNRRGSRNDTARVFWICLPTKNTDAERVALPYPLDELKRAAEDLTKLKDVGIKSLPSVELPFEHTHVVRRKDVIDLFDTTPDLAGHDIDIDRYVRDVEQADVRVFWRAWDMNEQKAPPNEKVWRRVGRVELCPAPIGDFKKFVGSTKVRGNVWRWDFLDGEWRRVSDKSDIYAGQTYLVHASAGGYHPDTGWMGTDSKSAVDSLGPVEPEDLSDDAYDDEGLSKTDRWQTIAQHTDDVYKGIEQIINGLQLDDEQQVAALRAAARWHDWGKAHPKFQIKIDDGQEFARPDRDGNTHRHGRPDGWRGCDVVGKAPGERKGPDGAVGVRGYWSRITTKDGARPYFRHELASALALLRPDVQHGTLEGADRDLIVYLIAAHHGKVRLSIRSMPNETRPPTDNGTVRRFARGVWDTELLPSVDLGGDVVAPQVMLSLEPMEIGLCEEAPFAGQPSWLGRTIKLRDILGPFRLAYLEALLRAADWRASAAAVEQEQPRPAEEVARA